MWRAVIGTHTTSSPATLVPQERRDHGFAVEFIWAEQLQVAPQAGSPGKPGGQAAAPQWGQGSPRSDPETSNGRALRCRLIRGPQPESVS